jgi:hypothetical protein
MKIRSVALELLHADRQTDKHGEANWRIFATSLLTVLKRFFYHVQTLFKILAILYLKTVFVTLFSFDVE